MELNREQIVKALECCTSQTEGCGACPRFPCAMGCVRDVMYDALSLIKELTEEVEGLKQCLEHEHDSFMETFGEWNDKCEKLAEERDGFENLARTAIETQNRMSETIEELTEENERLRAEIDNGADVCHNCHTEYADKIEQAKAVTVRKMHSMLCEGRVSNDNVVIVANQIAKEMLEGNNE